MFFSFGNQLTEQQQRHNTFGLHYRLLKGVCRNGNLTERQIFDELFPIIGDKHHPTRLYRSLQRISDAGTVIQKKYKRTFEEFYIDHNNLAMMSESYYDLVCLANMRDFVKAHNFQRIDQGRYTSILVSLEKLQARLEQGDSFSNCLLGLKKGELATHEQIDQAYIKYFGVDFRNLDNVPNNMWDTLSTTQQDAKSVLVDTYNQNGADIACYDDDETINLKCFDSMLKTIVNSTEQNKDRMSLNTAVKYVKTHEFKDYEPGELPTQI